MTTRRHFLESTLLAGGLAFTASAHAQGKTRYVDKLTDGAGKYAVAPLPYAYDALEPAIDARTVELHYNNHHKPAATAANNAEEQLAKGRESGQLQLVKHYEKELAYQLSSHILHSIYWTNLGGKGGEPRGELAKAIAAELARTPPSSAARAAARVIEASAGACSATTRRRAS
jgi:Fe-Mn family superoxide dismutase